MLGRAVHGRSAHREGEQERDLRGVVKNPDREPHRWLPRGTGRLHEFFPCQDRIRGYEHHRAGNTGETLDSPSIERVTAWRRGRLIFDNASLGEAAAEFNRYGTRKLMIEDPAARNLRVGGVFKINDRYSFAQAMADTYDLRIITHDKTIILTGKQPDSQ